MFHIIKFLIRVNPVDVSPSNQCFLLNTASGYQCVNLCVPVHMNVSLAASRSDTNVALHTDNTGSNATTSRTEMSRSLWLHRTQEGLQLCDLLRSPLASSSTSPTHTRSLLPTCVGSSSACLSVCLPTCSRTEEAGQLFIKRKQAGGITRGHRAMRTVNLLATSLRLWGSFDWK